MARQICQSRRARTSLSATGRRVEILMAEVNGLVLSALGNAAGTPS